MSHYDEQRDAHEAAILLAKMEAVKTETWAYSDFLAAEYYPSKYYFRNACGDYVFMFVKDRTTAQTYIDVMYDGMYKLRCTVNEKPKTDRITAR